MRTSGACEGAYLSCTNQQSLASYNVCRPVSGDNVSSLSAAIKAAASAAAGADAKAANALSAASAAQNAADSKLSATQANELYAAKSNNYITSEGLGAALKSNAVKDDLSAAITGSGVLSSYATTESLKDVVTEEKVKTALGLQNDSSSLITSTSLENAVAAVLRDAAGSCTKTDGKTTCTSSLATAFDTLKSAADGASDQ